MKGVFKKKYRLYYDDYRLILSLYNDGMPKDVISDKWEVPAYIINKALTKISNGEIVVKTNATIKDRCYYILPLDEYGEVVASSKEHFFSNGYNTSRTKKGKSRANEIEEAKAFYSYLGNKEFDDVPLSVVCDGEEFDLSRLCTIGRRSIIEKVKQWEADKKKTAEINAWLGS